MKLFTLAEIKEIIQLVDQASLQYFELEQSGSRIILDKGQRTEQAQTGEKSAAASPVSAAKESVIKEEPDKATIFQITAPMAGTFYTAAEPGAEAFVKAGQEVAEGTVVCIVESMKLFTEVEAEVKGKIVEILVENEATVGYGQPLFTVKRI